MTFCVENPNITDQQPPLGLSEMISFVENVRSRTDEIFVQISGYPVELIKAIAEHFECNFFDTEDQQGMALNPFTVIYITHDGEIKPRAINERSKIIFYARRPIHHHH